MLKDPEAIVGVKALGDASISIAVRPWVQVPDVGPASAEINQAIVGKFGAAGVDYPASLRELRLVGGDAGPAAA